MKVLRKLLAALIFVLSGVSTIRLVKFTLLIPLPTSTLAAIPPSFRHAMPPNSAPQYLNISGITQQSSRNHIALTNKEFKFLSGLIASRVPCNLLVFGLEHQYLSLHSLNRGGYIIFLDDNPKKLGTVRINSHTAKIYRVKYNTSAANAFKLLKYGWTNQFCKPNQGQLRCSPCKLALTNLLSKVYDTVWDVMVVDGPSGHIPKAPRRMAAIYTASKLARATDNST